MHMNNTSIQMYTPVVLHIQTQSHMHKSIVLTVTHSHTATHTSYIPTPSHELHPHHHTSYTLTITQATPSPSHKLHPHHHTSYTLTITQATPSPSHKLHPHHHTSYTLTITQATPSPSHKLHPHHPSRLLNVFNGSHTQSHTKTHSHTHTPLSSASPWYICTLSTNELSLPPGNMDSSSNSHRMPRRSVCILVARRCQESKHVAMAMQLYKHIPTHNT